jgi:transcriptional regulator with XRE-family HTH domain
MNGQEFRELRRKLGLSQNELARALGIMSGRTIQRIEAGDEVRGPLALAIQKLADDKAKE